MLLREMLQLSLSIERANTLFDIIRVVFSLGLLLATVSLHQLDIFCLFLNAVLIPVGISIGCPKSEHSMIGHILNTGLVWRSDTRYS